MTTPPEQLTVEQMIDKRLEDILRHGQVVLDANGNPNYVSPTAAMWKIIIDWNESKKLQNRDSGNSTGAILAKLRGEGVTISGDMPAVGDGDDAATR